jgi:hypothetical protein
VARAHGDLPGADTAGFALELEPAQAGSYGLEVEGPNRQSEPLATLRLAGEAPPRLFFMHIAKAGGSTINRYFRSRFPAERAVQHLESSTAWRDDPARLLKADYLSGHVSLFSIDSRLDLSAYALVTVLREPLDQLVSHLSWVRRLAEPGEEERLALHPPYVQAFAARLAGCDFTRADAVSRLVESLSREERGLVDNCQVRYLTARSPDRVDASDLDLARRALPRFARIGLVDRLDAFLAGVARDMAWPLPGAFGRENVTPSFYGLEEPAPGVLEALEPLLAFDRELVAGVRESLAARWRPEATAD